MIDNNKENFLQQFQNLSNPNQEVRNYANLYIMKLIQSEQVWVISKQLLDQQNQQYKFFGAQMLYRKVQLQYQTMNKQWRQQLKSYVYKYFYDNCQNLSKPVLSKIAGTAAIIASTLFLDSWKNFLQDLSGIMATSIDHLKGGLQILQIIPEQIQRLRNQTFSYKQLIKKQFLKKQKLILTIFNSVFDTKQYSCIEKNLSCIQTWTNFTLPIMKDPFIIRNLITNSLISLNYFNISCDILVNAMKQHPKTNYTTIDKLSTGKQQLSQVQFTNLLLIIQFILENNKNLYGERPVNNIQYYKIYGHLVRQVLLNFPWLIIQDITNIGIPFLEIMINTLKHKSLKVSYCALQFWTCIQSILKKQKHANLERIIQFYYIKVYQIILEKTKLKMIANHIVEQQQEVEDTQNQEKTQVDQTKYIAKVSFKDYRQECVQLFQIIYNVLYQKQAEQGVKIFFSYIIQLLQSSFQLPDREIRIQLGLYVTKSALEGMICGNFKQYLRDILIFTTTLYDVSNVVKNQIFKIYTDSIKQIKELCLSTNILGYILQYINDPVIGQIASFSFYTLMESMNSHNDQQLIQRLITFYIQHFSKMKDDIIMQKFIEGFMILLLQTENKSMLKIYMRKFLQFSLHNFKKCLEHQKTDQILRCLKQLRFILVTFEIPKKLQNTKINADIIQFGIKHLEYLEITMNYCFNSNMKYSELNELGFIQKNYKSIIKLVGKVPNPNLFNIVMLSMKFLSKNLKQYCNLLGIFTFTLDQMAIINNQSLQNNHNILYFDVWIKSNYHQFNNFYIKQLQSNTDDPDVIRNFFKVQERLLFYKQDFFFQYEFHNEILKLALHFLTTISQSYMTKAILFFLNKYVSSVNYQIYKNFENILKLIFINIPRIESTNNGTIAEIMIRICKYFLESSDPISKKNILFNVFLQLMHQMNFTNITQANLKILALAFEYYVMVQNKQLIKVSVMDINSLCKGCYGSDIFLQIEMRLQTCKKQNKSKMK